MVISDTYNIFKLHIIYLQLDLDQIVLLVKDRNVELYTYVWKMRSFTIAFDTPSYYSVIKLKLTFPALEKNLYSSKSFIKIVEDNLSGTLYSKI